ncbi:MAG: ABC transporter substrate-binding protein [Bacillota bacterium]|nr:ABC transporter substrate-binding protein [Bacillota bacterium]
MKKKLLAIIMGAFMCCFALAGCGGSDSESADSGEAADSGLTPVTFVLDWTPNTNHTGVYVAQAKGYFEEAGLDVEIVQPPDDGAEAMVGSGKAQFGVSFQDYLVPAFAGKEKTMPITAVAAILQHNLSGIMSASDKGITRPKDMEGHSYATWELPIEQAILKDCVEKDGGDFSKVELIPETIDDEVSALKADQVDSIWVYYGWAGVNAETKDFPINYFAFKDINDAFDYYSPVIIANDDFLESDPDTAKAFLAAVSKGYEFAIENPAEAADILIKANPEIDGDLVKASQEYLTDEYKAEAKQWGVIDKARWNKFYEFINEEGLAEDTIPADVGFTNDYLPQ